MADDGRTVQEFATRGVLTIAGVVAIAHCAATIFGRGYWFDEVYMLAIGRFHLDWGSADQPPLAPAIAALGDAIAPGSILVLRLPAVLATAGAVVVAALIAREIGCDTHAQLFTAAAQATALWTTLAGHWLTPYAFEPVQWMLLVWFLIRWQRVGDDRLLLAAGVITGVAAITKFQVLLLCLALVVAVAICGPRELLRRPLLWVGAAVAVLITAPTLLWQQVHGWPQLQMTSVVAGEADALYGGRTGIATQLLIFAGVAGLFLALYGIVLLLHENAVRPYRYLGVAFALLYAIFVLTQGRPYYLAGLYAPLMAVGALGLQRRRESGRESRWWLTWPVWSVSTALAVSGLVLSATIVRSDVGEQIVRRAADAYQRLPAAQRERTALFGQSYIVAAYLDGLGRRHGLPEAHSGNRSYGYFAPPPADVDTVIYVGRNDDAIRPHFADSTRVGDVGDDMHVFLLVGLREPWDSVWPELRTLTVS